MTAFEFIIVFFSFAYALAFSHVLFAAARMIRHRRQLVFSWPHALWMANAALLLLSNWISLYDFRDMAAMSLGTILMLFVFVTTLYFTSALVTPDFEEGDGYDMQTFHRREFRTYVGAILALHLVSFIANTQAGDAGISNWGSQNLIVYAMLPPTILPLFTMNRIVQLICPLIFLVENLVFLAVFYPIIGLTAAT